MKQKLTQELIQTALEIQAQGVYDAFIWYTGSAGSIDISILNKGEKMLKKAVLNIYLYNEHRKEEDYVCALNELKALHADYHELPSDELINA